MKRKNLKWNLKEIEMMVLDYKKSISNELMQSYRYLACIYYSKRTLLCRENLFVDESP
jgi:thiamine pyrophosphokinase